MNKRVPDEYAETEKIWNNQFICVFLANAMMYLGQYMVQTLVTKYAKELGAEPSVLGIVASAFALTALVFKLISAPALDAFKRKYVIFGAMLVLAGAFFGYSFAKSVEMVIGFRLLQGAAQAFTATGYLAMATDALPKSKITSGISVFTLAQTICMAVSPAIGLAIADRYGFPMTFITASVLVCTASVLSLRIKPSSRPRKHFAIIPKNFIAKQALLPGVLMFLLLVPSCLINSYLVIYATDIVGITGIGTYFTVNTLVLLFTRPLLGKLTDKRGFTLVFIPALCMFAVSYFIISYATTLPVFLLAAVIAAFGNGICSPLINSLAMKSVPPESRGAASSTAYMGTDLGNLVGPSVGAAIIGVMGYSNMWRVMTVPIFLTIGITLLARKKIVNIEKAQLRDER